MANKKNKVKFNICNVHYAPITVAEEGTVSFGTPVPMPGAVSISMDPTGEPESFYADGIEYYVINNNQGYDGDLELAMIPESFRTDILKEEQDANKVLVENANSETGSFALLFEFDGDIRRSVCLPYLPHSSWTQWSDVMRNSYKAHGGSYGYHHQTQTRVQNCLSRNLHSPQAPYWHPAPLLRYLCGMIQGSLQVQGHHRIPGCY